MNRENPRSILAVLAIACSALVFIGLPAPADPVPADLAMPAPVLAAPVVADPVPADFGPAGPSPRVSADGFTAGAVPEAHCQEPGPSVPVGESLGGSSCEEEECRQLCGVCGVCITPDFCACC